MDEDTLLYTTARYASIQLALQLMTATSQIWSVAEVLEAAQEIEDHLTEDA